MGERHLVYARVDDTGYWGRQEQEQVYYNNNLLGLHHQWLLGYSALNCLVNVLDFHSRNIFIDGDKKMNFSPFHLNASDYLYRQGSESGCTHAEHALQAFYTACHITGFWGSSPTILQKDGFFYNDNNTGITIIDFLEFDQPKYCFMNPGSMFVNHDLASFESCTPLDAPTYLMAFGEPPKKWSEGHLTMLLDKISTVPLLTKEELYDIFLPQHALEDQSGLEQLTGQVISLPRNRD
ncbi:hypothetical protein QUF63_02590 [Anaerolineales bacterium HSG25]|nr:hypothetical protein [Anaerolineales bacterium HSG25]